MPKWTLTLPPGLEPVALRELEGLGVRAKSTPGALLFEAELAAGALLARSLRTANRLSCEVLSGRARSLEELAAVVREADWRPFLRLRDEVELSTHTARSRLSRKDMVEKKVLNAIHDQLRGGGVRALPASRPHRQQRLQIHLEDDQLRISIDAGGERLGVRGWRQAQGKAPLRENLAASRLLLAGWDGDEALLDPFCGSGTIPIEAALLASGRPPGTGRPYAYEAWPVLQGGAAPRPSPARRSTPAAPIVGSDRHGPALADAHQNAERAGVSIQLVQADVSEPPVPASAGLVLTNPPYGMRLGNQVAGVYRALGRALQGPLSGWRAMFICPDAELARMVSPRVFPITSFSNGGTRVTAWALDD